MSKLGILGGTFDPIHNGHIYMAQVSMEQLGLDKIIIIPTGKVPHKDNKRVTHHSHRYNMACIAFNESENYSVSDIEILKDGYSFTYETLGELKKIYPDDEFYFIVGADSFYSIDHWRKPEEIFKLASLAVVDRGVDTDSDILKHKDYIEEKYKGKAYVLKALGPDISSTKIRENIKQGKSVDKMLPALVLKYIKEHNLYLEL